MMKLLKTIGRNTDHIKNDIDIGGYLWSNFASRNQLEFYEVEEDYRLKYFIKNVGKNDVVIVSEDGKRKSTLLGNRAIPDEESETLWPYPSFVIDSIAKIPSQDFDGYQKICLIKGKDSD